MRYVLAEALIKAYRYFLSPLIHFLAGPGFGCRFSPSCSEYASESIKIHGMAKGSFLAVKRIGRCHPGSRGGYDPVPEKIR